MAFTLSVAMRIVPMTISGFQRVGLEAALFVSQVKKR
jgi:hypothetical protein